MFLQMLCIASIFTAYIVADKETDTIEAEYVKLKISPDPEDNNWPRRNKDKEDVENEIFCPPSVIISFKHSDSNVRIYLDDTFDFRPTDLPIFVGSKDAISKWIPVGADMTTPICLYRDPVIDAIISFERRDSRTFLSGSFMKEDGTYALESPEVSTVDFEASGVILPKDTTPGKDDYILYKISNDNVTNIDRTTRRRKRSVKQENYVEILAVIDYRIYKRWYDWSPERTPNRRERDAVKHIAYNFLYVFDEIDAIYERFPSQYNSITVSLTGFYIALDATGSKFVEDIGEEDGSVNLNALRIAMSDWFQEHRKQIDIPTDHAMLFTGLDLYKDSSNGKNLLYLGQSMQRGICDDYHSVSIIEDTGKYGSATVGAHELGHNLGARHDGNNNDCEASDHYLMTNAFDTGHPNYFTHSRMFSNCSVKAIDNLLKIHSKKEKSTDCDSA